MRNFIILRGCDAAKQDCAPRALGLYSCKTHPDRNKIRSPFCCLQTDSSRAQATNSLISVSLAR
ncbi:hypothetical protein C0Z19_13970 [Trinickia soli]|uniref:Uncharacterized protein n=1 Tax=Trinickia soli TaxID=380675 RepID=A0A2N7W4Q2_9BURK|nr:hypothetical protein C0Z19_13970 [Trinickia soli]